MTGVKNTFTIVYAGPPSSGRRTSLAHLAGRQPTESPVRLDWDEEPFPCSLELQLVDSAIDEGLARRIDAVVFVVDPRRTRLEANERALERVQEQLSAAERSTEELPLVFQLNKLDLPLDASGAQMFAFFTGSAAPLPQLVRAPIATLKRRLRWPRCDYAETIASEGIGVRDALRRALKLCGNPPPAR